MYEMLTVESSFKFNSFKKIPTELFSGEKFKKLYYLSRLMLTDFLDIAELSQKNNWIDEDKKVYIINTYDTMQQKYGCSRPTISRAMKQLTAFGLIVTKRMGFGKPNRIYVVDWMKTAGVEVKDTATNKITAVVDKMKDTVKRRKAVEVDVADTPQDKLNSKETQKKASLRALTGSEEKATNESKKILNTVNYTALSEKVNTQISSEELKVEFPEDEKLITQIVNCIEKVLSTSEKRVWIGQGNIETDRVVAVYEALDKDQVAHVIRKYLALPYKVTKSAQYLKTMLYNVHMDYDLHAHKEEKKPYVATNSPNIKPTAFVNFQQSDWEFDEAREDAYIERVLSGKENDSPRPSNEEIKQPVVSHEEIVKRVKEQISYRELKVEFKDHQDVIEQIVTAMTRIYESRAMAVYFGSRSKETNEVVKALKLLDRAKVAKAIVFHLANPQKPSDLVEYLEDLLYEVSLE